jgi:hypothetical protein
VIKPASVTVGQAAPVVSNSSSPPKTVSVAAEASPKANESRSIDATVEMPARPIAKALVPPSITSAQPASGNATMGSAPAKPVAKIPQAELDATREMPSPIRTAPTLTEAVNTSAIARRESHPAAKAHKQTSAPKIAEKKPTVETVQEASEIHNLVIADAVRLLNWGRRWHELAELIARIADRPKLPEVRRILRSHRPTIEMRAAAAEEEEPEKEK